MKLSIKFPRAVKLVMDGCEKDGRLGMMWGHFEWDAKVRDPWKGWLILLFFTLMIDTRWVLPLEDYSVADRVGTLSQRGNSDDRAQARQHDPHVPDAGAGQGMATEAYAQAFPDGIHRQEKTKVKAARIVASVATIITFYFEEQDTESGIAVASKDNFPWYAGLTIYLLLVQTGWVLLFIAGRLIRHYWRQK